MAAVDLNNFLHSLAKYFVARAAAQEPAVSLECFGTPRSLWRNKVVELPDSNGPWPANLTDPYSVLRIYGGPGTQKDPQQRSSIQCFTSGTGEEAVLQRAQVLFECCLFPPDDPQQPLQPLRMTRIDGFDCRTDQPLGAWMLVSIDPTSRAGKIGVDSRGRPQVSFNFDAGYFFIQE